MNLTSALEIARQFYPTFDDNNLFTILWNHTDFHTEGIDDTELAAQLHDFKTHQSQLLNNLLWLIGFEHGQRDRSTKQYDIALRVADRVLDSLSNLCECDTGQVLRCLADIAKTACQTTDATTEETEKNR